MRTFNGLLVLIARTEAPSSSILGARSRSSKRVQDTRALLVPQGKRLRPGAGRA
jgi:hypothetical protein